MKRIFFISLLALCCAASSFAQGFNTYKEKRDKSFEKFVKERNKGFEEYKRKRDGFLNGETEEIKAKSTFKMQASNAQEESFDILGLIVVTDAKEISDYGFCISTNENSTTKTAEKVIAKEETNATILKADDKNLTDDQREAFMLDESENSVAMVISLTINRLTPGTTYYVRAYSVCDDSTAYSAPVAVATKERPVQKEELVIVHKQEITIIHKNEVAEAPKVAEEEKPQPAPVAVSNANVWDGKIAAAFSGGSGRLNEPYIINSGGELLLLKNTNTKGVYFKLGSDIDLNNHNWLPFDFYGTLDGDGHTISNLKVQRDDITRQGLFATIEGTVSNLAIKGVHIVNKTNNACTGALAGCANNGKITNCHVIFTTGSKLFGTAYTGGIVGSARGNTFTMTYCTVTATDNSFVIDGYEYTGGAIGYGHSYSSEMSEISNVKVNCNVYGSTAGGLWGCKERRCTFTNCYYKGSINGKNVGGITGQDREQGNYLACKTDVKLTGEEGAGGIIGNSYSYSSNNAIIACYSNGTIEAKNAFTISSGGKTVLCYSTATGGINLKTGNSYHSAWQNDIATKIKEEYSEYEQYWNLSNTWEWKGRINGIEKKSRCPRLAWE